MFGCLQVGPRADIALCLVRRFIDSRPFRFSGGLGLGVYLAIWLKPRPGKLEMALNVQDVVRTALLPGYIVLSGPAIARGASPSGPVITMALVYLITVSLHAK